MAIEMDDYDVKQVVGTYVESENKSRRSSYRCPNLNFVSFGTQKESIVR